MINSFKLWIDTHLKANEDLNQQDCVFGIEVKINYNDEESHHTEQQCGFLMCSDSF